MTRVLVCGGRDYGYMLRGVTRCTMAWYDNEKRTKLERALLVDTLNRLAPSAVIHGSARGADELADIWAKRNSVGRVRLELRSARSHPPPCPLRRRETANDRQTENA